MPETEYKSCAAQVKSKDLAEGICKLRGIENEDDYTDEPARKLYVRIHAYINGIEGSDILSNVITLESLKEYCAKERIQTIVRDCIKLKIIERISAVQQLMSTEKIFIMDTCKTLIEALSNSVWDPNHDDIRLDDGTIDMDVIDAMEYALIPQINIVIKTNNYKKNNMEII